MDGYGTGYLAGSNPYLAHDFRRGPPVPELSYAPCHAPKYPLCVQHLPKGQDSVTFGTQGYLQQPHSRKQQHVPSATNDPFWSHKW